MFEELDFLLGILPEAALKLGVALLCGFLLGVEREINEKPAGLRTIILITVGSTLFMIVSDLVTLTTEGPEAITRVDPSRIASQVVTGIGFLGAGAIIQSRGAIYGLTTAATIWVAAGIGLCVGVGFPVLGIGITFLVLIVLVALYPVRTWLSRRGENSTLDLQVPNDSLVLERVKNILGNHDVSEENLTLLQRTEDCLLLRVFYKRRKTGKPHMLTELAAIDGLQGASVEEELPASNASSPGERG